MLRAARREPTRLVIGIDADAASMRKAAASAIRRKTAVPNALFVVAAAEVLPEELAGIADRITVHFPWGSLLRGVVTGDAAILQGVSSVAATGADLTVLWSILPRDGSAVGVRPLPAGDLATAFAHHDLDVRELRPASLDEIHATGSSWAKRLSAGTTRPVTILRATKR